MNLTRRISPMLRIASLAAVVAATAAVAATTQPTDRESLQGTWKLTGGELNGKPLSPKLIAKNIRLMIDGDHWDNLTGDDPKPQRLTFKLDPSTTPKSVNLIDPTDANPEAEGELGIYKVDGETLTVNLSRPGGKQRPTAFHSSDRTMMVRVYTRVRP